MKFVIVFHVRYYEEYHNRDDGMNGACSTQGEKCIAYKTFVGKPCAKTELERRRRSWQDNIKLCPSVKKKKIYIYGGKSSVLIVLRNQRRGSCEDGWHTERLLASQGRLCTPC
jgi:hypothetical protein